MKLTIVLLLSWMCFGQNATVYRPGTAARFFHIAYSFEGETKIGYGSFDAAVKKGFPPEAWIRSTVLDAHKEWKEVTVISILEFKSERDYLDYIGAEHIASADATPKPLNRLR